MKTIKDCFALPRVKMSGNHRWTCLARRRPFLVPTWQLIVGRGFELAGFVHVQGGQWSVDADGRNAQPRGRAGELLVGSRQVGCGRLTELPLRLSQLAQHDHGSKGSQHRHRDGSLRDPKSSTTGTVAAYLPGGHSVVRRRRTTAPVTTASNSTLAPKIR